MAYIKNAALVAVGVIAAAILAEAIMRYLPEYSFEAMTSLNFKWDECADKPRYRPSHIYGYEHIPNSAPDINSFGMRDKEYSLKKPKGVYRILLLGDSICEFGRWSDYLEDRLSLRGKYEILNCGTAAWGLAHYYLYLKNDALKYDPDLVLIGLCLNDVGYKRTSVIFRDKQKNKTFFYDVNTGPVDSEDITLSVNPFLFRHSGLYRFAAAHLFMSKNRNIGADEETLIEMKKIANGKICAVVFPYLKPLKKYDKNEALEYRVTVEYLKKSKIDYLDLTPYFNSLGGKIEDFRNSPQDKIHFNDKANKLKSKVIYDWLIKEMLKFDVSKDTALPHNGAYYAASADFSRNGRS